MYVAICSLHTIFALLKQKRNCNNVTLTINSQRKCHQFCSLYLNTLTRNTVGSIIGSSFHTNRFRTVICYWSWRKIYMCTAEVNGYLYNYSLITVSRCCIIAEASWCNNCTIIKKKLPWTNTLENNIITTCM